MTERFKFRVWDNENKEFLKGYHFITTIIPNDIEMGLDYVGQDGDLYDEMDIVIQQCTGLKDKNGKFIFEGDILKDPNWVKQESEYAPPEPLFKIEYHKPSHRLMVYITGMDEYDEIDQILNQLDECPLEVIGNIYENPELLELEVQNAG